METKTCPKCGGTKVLTEFHKNRCRKDGLATECKTCVLRRAKAKYDTNTEVLLERHRVWCAANREKISDYNKGKYYENIDATRQRHRDSRQRNIGNSRKRSRDYWARAAAELKPAYVALVLGMSTKELTPELLELKRQKIELHRLQRQLQATLKELNRDERRNPEPADHCNLSALGPVDNG